MPLTTVNATYSADPLIPLYYENEGPPIELAINLAPSVTYPRGQVLQAVGAAANEVWTIADAGTVSGGTFTISGTNPFTATAFTTAAIAYNANNAAVKAAIEAAIGFGVTVTVAGSGLPTNDTTITFGGAAAGLPIGTPTIDGTALTGAGATLTPTRTTKGSTAGTFTPYTTGPAVCVLKYACVTDAQGRISYGGQATNELATVGTLTAPAYFGGIFDTKELVGMDADAVTDLGRLLSGTYSDGVLRIG